ncbi:dethiobiotin synthase [Amantichitinum ursilacus]|uniref:ATP-dependent dethiobiotin synthetase BioD n=1 Tax=Amantichitinum ursilacus TaxID=857265 RepID=A0A0N0XJ72_9NEIS|nr:dethiobiotin synthase [Amantichitinum ursilacus]KPC53532.1 ATP-dependent dethiobiotin synthetase BioD 1 [Amantichitinum ursilacus]
MAARGWFITGTDTEVGKTVATSQLLRAFVANGYATAAMKPVASGCEVRRDEQGGEWWWNADVAAHAEASNLALPEALTNPYRFLPPISPHLAARDAGVEVSLPHLLDCAQQIGAQSDVLLVEGAGGWLAPLNETACMADLAAALGYPVILVVGMRLGCINHALLTVQSIKAQGVPLAGWIANQVDPEMSRYDDNLATLQQRIAAPLLGEIRHSAQALTQRLSDETVRLLV